MVRWVRLVTKGAGRCRVQGSSGSVCTCVMSGRAGGCRVEGAGSRWKRVRLTGKLQALDFLRHLNVLRLFHVGGRLLVAGLRRTHQVSKGGCIRNQTK